MSSDFEDAVGGEANSVTAAHEAGHALVAWLSPAIESIHGSLWVQEGDEGLVRVRMTPRKPATAFTIWEQASILAAGMAAEIITHGCFRTVPCRSDLKGIRKAAVGLCGPEGRLAPVSPWGDPDPNQLTPPFERYFVHGLEARHLEIFRRAYLRARDRIKGHRHAYERLRTAMIVKIELSSEEIASALRIPKA